MAEKLNTEKKQSWFAKLFGSKNGSKETAEIKPPADNTYDYAAEYDTTSYSTHRAERARGWHMGG